MIFVNHFYIIFYMGNKRIRFVNVLQEVKFNLSSLMIDIPVCLSCILY